ncbi:MAG: hypothetical protein JNK38_14175, partial [Acidobacteria bacterium]|nr:hypothetical protein [Acidobacteriota bacterium]
MPNENLTRPEASPTPTEEPQKQTPPDSIGARSVQAASVVGSVIVTGDGNTVVMGEKRTVEEKPPVQIGIPASPEIFLGREEDMDELKARIGIYQAGKETGPLQVLTAVRGWPGIGKTALATVFADDEDVRTAFPDGVLWASMGPDPKLIQEMAAWGRALGTDDILRAPTLKEATTRLSGLLRQKRLLMVVDDVWEVEHVAPFAQARGNDCALLVTTRLPLVANGLSVPAQAIYNLPALNEERALELLGRLAPAVLSAHPDECRQLVNAIECLPLALHVAGRLLKAEAELGWGVSELMKELQTGKALIEAKAGANLMDLEQETIPSVAT